MHIICKLAHYNKCEGDMLHIDEKEVLILQDLLFCLCHNHSPNSNKNNFQNIAKIS